MGSIWGGVVGFLIGLVVVAAIAVVTYSVTKELSKPATESNGQRREQGRGSRLKPIASAAVVASKGGKTVVDSGRQFGRNLAELAKSSVAMPAEPPARPSPNGAGGATAAPSTRRRPAAGGQPAAPAPQPSKVAARAGATVVAARAARSVIRAVPGAVEPSEEYEFIVPSVPRRARHRLYPRWWKRIFSFIVLGLLTLAFGIGVGAAIGALLTLVNRAIQSSL
jgi:hypothetical protein